MEEFEDDEMSETWNICINCYENDETTLLVALDII